MDKVGLHNNKVSFSGLKISQEGARKLVEAFKEEPGFLKTAIPAAKTNIATDIFVKDNEILVQPNVLTGLAPMRMRNITENRDVFRVDYLKYDIYNERKNMYYTIHDLLPNMPYLYKYNETGLFGKLFEGALKIAENIDVRYHDKILKKMNRDKKLDAIVSKLGIDTVK